MDTNRAVALLERLAEKTHAGQLTWGRDVFQTPNKVVTEISGHYVSVSEVERERTDPDYIIAVEDVNGEVLDSFSDVDLRNALSSPFAKFRELYRAAWSNAMGVDIAVDEILKALD